MLFNNIETPDWSMYSLSGGAGAIGNVLLVTTYASVPISPQSDGIRPPNPVTRAILPVLQVWRGSVPVTGLSRGILIEPERGGVKARWGGPLCH